MGFGDLAAIEFTDFRLTIFGEIVDKYFAINFRGMHGGAAFVQKVTFFRWTLQKEVEFFANQSLLALVADAFLNLHQVFAAAFNLPGGKLFVQLESASAFLIGVAECTHPIELSFAHKLT